MSAGPTRRDVLKGIAADHPFWLRHRPAVEAAGHDGGDFFTLRHFYDSLRRGKAPGIDVVTKNRSLAAGSRSARR